MSSWVYIDHSVVYLLCSVFAIKSYNDDEIDSIMLIRTFNDCQHDNGIQMNHVDHILFMFGIFTLHFMVFIMLIFLLFFPRYQCSRKVVCLVVFIVYFKNDDDQKYWITEFNLCNWLKTSIKIHQYRLLILLVTDLNCMGIRFIHLSLNAQIITYIQRQFISK